MIQLMSTDGTLIDLTSNDLEKIHLEFGETWRVAETETSFTYENEESYAVS